jgi:hypothetical protein
MRGRRHLLDDLQHGTRGLRAEWEEDPTRVAPPNGESVQQVADRAASFLRSLVQWELALESADAMPDAQPAELRWPDAAVSVHNVKPPRETRGIRGWPQRLEFIDGFPVLVVGLGGDQDWLGVIHGAP